MRLGIRAAWLLGVAGIATGGLGAIPASAQQAARAFDIPSGPLAPALRAFARQAGVGFVFPEDMVAGKTSPGLKGAFTAGEALKRIVAGSGLDVVNDPSGALSLKAVVPKAQAAAPTQSEIVVTGTRLDPRFAGAAPVQIVKQETAEESGLLDSAEVLRNQPAVSGPRSQLHFSSESFGGTYDGGPGSQTIALRGFLPSQTLVLLNGRRIVAAGTEGVPTGPDLSTIPTALVDQYEVLTDGASPVYGSDAIAGIINIKLKQNFDGLNVFGAFLAPQVGGGQTGIVSGSYGKTFDRGFIGFGAEYRQTEGVEARKVNFFGPACPAHYDRDSNGQIRTIDAKAALLPGTSRSSCITTFNAYTGFFQTGQGNVYFNTPGRTNIGVPNYSLDIVSANQGYNSPGYGFRQYDSNGNGIIDKPVVDEFGYASGDNYFPDPDNTGKVGVDSKSPIYSSLQGPRAERAHYVAPLKQVSVLSYGQYDTDVFGDATLFYEASYNRRTNHIRTFGAPISQFFGNYVVRADNPYNPCGLESVTRCFAYPGNGKAQEVAIFQKIDGDGDTIDTSVDRYRVVVGAKGDFNLLNGIGPDWLGLKDWRYELSVNYGRSEGKSRRPAVLKDRLLLSLRTTVRDPVTGKITCGAADNPDGLPGDPNCVPFNPFSNELASGRQLAPAEAAYLFGSLDYQTNLDLIVVSGVLTGKAFNLPAGPVSLVLGGEYRYDAVDAQANADGANQNFATVSAFTQPGAKGSRSVEELYGEIGVPIVHDKRFFHAIDVSAAGRMTHEQFTGTNGTYVARGRWEPTSWLALRGTYGTSFRSPNTYELFVLPYVSKTSPGFDPCLVPYSALDVSGTGYDPRRETRSPRVLDHCRADGVDPTSLGLLPNRFDLPSNTTIFQGGATDDLKPETSTALTGGIVATIDDRILPHWRAFNGFTLNLSATYYEIRVLNQLQQGNEFTVTNRCYSDTGDSAYCGRIKRGPDGLISSVITGFVNGSPRQTRGVDFNALLQKSFIAGKRPFHFAFDLQGNYELQNREGSGPEELDLAGSYEFPQLKLFATAQLRSDPWSLTWYTNYVGGATALFQPPSFYAQTCLDSEAPVTCTPISSLDEYFLHNASLTWRRNGLLLSIGVDNVFNTAPPRISALVENTGGTNTLLNGNYDVYGRTFIVRARKQF